MRLSKRIGVQYGDRAEGFRIYEGTRKLDIDETIRRAFGITCGVHRFTFRDDEGDVVVLCDLVEDGAQLTLTCNQAAPQDNSARAPGGEELGDGLDSASTAVVCAAEPRPAPPVEMHLLVEYEWNLGPRNYATSGDLKAMRVKVAVKSDDLLSDVCAQIASGLSALLTLASSRRLDRNA